MRRMFRTATVAVAVALLGGFFAFVAPTSLADPKKESKDPANLKASATVAPSRIGPGNPGIVTIVVEVRKSVHVYADKLKVIPKPVDGVTYGKPEVKTKPTSYVDPFSPNEPAESVFFDKIEIEIPFTLTVAALPPLMVGAYIKWSCCDEGQCYAPETTKEPVLAEVLAPLGWVRPAGAPPLPPAPAVEEPAMAPGADPVPAMAPDAPAPEKPPAKPAELTLESSAATVLVRATATEITLTFTPAEGYHLYPPGTKDGDPIRVTGKEAEGIRWRDPVHPIATDEIHEAWEWTQPYSVTEAAKSDPTFVVHWLGCAKQCDLPVEKTISIVHAGGKPDGALELVEVKKATGPVMVPKSAEGAAPGSPPVAGAVAPTGKLFPEIGNAKRESVVDAWWRELGLLILGPVFLAGIVLAFTPCVLPLIPITISIIGGSGGGEMSRGRLTFLLGCYVAGLSLAYGSIGLIASVTGGSMAAAFQSSIALWIISGVFVVLAFGMFGIFELQPPQWMQRLQGGAKGGNPAGAFVMGALGAVIASPCTGPVVAAMIVFTAQSGNTLVGFLMFLTLGLGMGSVLFVAGSLNLVARPGPWMVWVRYGFGVMIVGVALYYLADSEKISPRTLFLMGGVIALLSAILIQRHLIRKEGEEPGTATRRGMVVGVASALATLLVAVLTRPHEGTLEWTKIESREGLVAEVSKAKSAGKAVVVDFWATWCPKCKAWDRAVEADETLRRGFSKMALLRVDLSNEDRPWEAGVRDALDASPGQPFLLFFNSKGEILSESRMADGPSVKNVETFATLLKTMGVVK